MEERLLKRLKEARVLVDMQDGDTVLLRNVPSQMRSFNKPHTNLLIKRAHARMPYLVCVDEDLEYRGADQSLLRAFTAGHKQQGWRVLFVEQNADADLQRIVERALDALGFDGQEPVLSSKDEREENGKRKSLLESFGKNISEECATVVEPTVGRETEVADVVSSLLQWQLKFTVIEGRAGVGKTNLLYAIARKLRASRPDLQLLSVDLADLFAGTMFDAERENLFLALLNEAADVHQAVVAMEHLQALAGQVPRAKFHLANALDRGAKLLGTARSVHLIESHLSLRRTCVVELKEMNHAETEEVLRVLRERIIAHHHVRIDEGIMPTVVNAARAIDGVFPAKAIALLDAAAGRAALSDHDEIKEQDVILAALRFREDEEYPTLIAADS